MSTEFALTRFVVPSITTGLALFVDCDVLARANVEDIFHRAERERDKALWCVKHTHSPLPGIKMDGQIQSAYPRKNWSSLMLFDCDHPANRRLTPDFVNTAKGLDLHQMCWLDDCLIGDLDQSWNWLAGHSDPEIDPDIVHFTDGTPNLPGYENAPYAEEWWAALRRWAS